MAFEGRIIPTLDRHQTGYSRGIGDVVQAGLTVSGVSEVHGQFRDYKALAVYMTVFVSREVARRVLSTSLDHTPYDTGELFKSAFMSDVNGEDTLFGKFTVIDENIEGTEASSIKMPNIDESWLMAGGFGSKRAYTKYVVGYRDDKAPIIHENPKGQVWRQETNSPRNGVKMDHFVLYAYNKHRDLYSAAMRTGMKGIEDFVAGRTRQPLGKPRLIKKVT